MIRTVSFAAALGAFAAAAAALAQTSKPVTAKILETQKTVAGQPLEAPAGQLEAIATTVDLADDAEIPVHMHFWPRYVYVQEGELELTLLDSGRVLKFRKGQMIVEPLRLWHKGRVTKGPARLLSVEQVPPGQANTVPPPDAEPKG
jgi:quercetin dioxygenase-like cupin family protein